jgi:hypothetical protein
MGSEALVMMTTQLKHVEYNLCRDSIDIRQLIRNFILRLLSAERIQIVITPQRCMKELAARYSAFRLIFYAKYREELLRLAYDKITVVNRCLMRANVKKFWPYDCFPEDYIAVVESSLLFSMLTQ